MSEQPTAPASDRGKKILGLNRGTAIGVGVVGVAVVIILILRARKNAAAASTTASTTGTCPDGSAPDANGNCPQASQDFSGQLETLQSEIAALQGAMASGGGSGGGSAGSVGAATGTTTAPPTTAPVTTPPAGTAPGAPKAAAGPISNLQATSVGTTTATVRWNPAQGATGGYAYEVRDVAGKGGPVKAGNTRATSVTVSGLKARTTYNFGVQGLPGGPGNNTHFTTK